MKSNKFEAKAPVLVRGKSVKIHLLGTQTKLLLFIRLRTKKEKNNFSLNHLSLTYFQNEICHTCEASFKKLNFIYTHTEKMEYVWKRIYKRKRGVLGAFYAINDMHESIFKSKFYFSILVSSYNNHQQQHSCILFIENISNKDAHIYTKYMGNAKKGFGNKEELKSIFPSHRTIVLWYDNFTSNSKHRSIKQNVKKNWIWMRENKRWVTERMWKEIQNAKHIARYSEWKYCFIHVNLTRREWVCEWERWRK